MTSEIRRTDDLDYELPAELIAQRPGATRDGSRLLVVDRAAGTFRDETFASLPEFFSAGDLCVFNNTKVVPAKLTARRATGGKIDGLFLADLGDGNWEVLLRGTSRLKPGERLMLQPAEFGDALDLGEHRGRGRWTVRLVSDCGTVEVLERVGRTPLPPYIRRDGADGDADRARYQTVYAEVPGAIAAPTAGLHFSAEVLDRLREGGVDSCCVTLHVGMGTFSPIAVDELSDHTMHEEWYTLTEEAAGKTAGCRDAGGRVLAVGTTTVRVLESCVGSAGTGWTDIFIRPPYRFKCVDALLTNFHLPRSTLLALVMAFAGIDLMREVYEHAVRQRYRFFSYGDAMLIV
jgi:S-adenosylmethionine:tRNA ribosyltransferase-isomerase